MGNEREIQERVKGMYNDCWLSYKQYLKEYDVGKFQERAEELQKKYGCRADVTDLLFWFVPVVNMIREAHDKEAADMESRDRDRGSGKQDGGGTV